MRSMFRCGRVLCFLGVFMLFGMLSHGAEPAEEAVKPRGDPEWVEIPASEVELPPLKMSDLIHRIKEANAPGDRVDCWEMRYHVKQVPNPNQHQRNQRTDADIHLARSGDAWRFDVTYNDERQAPYNIEYYVSGNRVTNLMHRAKSIGLSNDVGEVCNYQPMHPLPPFLIPAVEAPPGVMPDQFTPGRFCDLIAALDNPGAKLLPWCTRIDDKSCYVIETSRKVTIPVFRDIEESNAWTQANPTEWEKCRLGGAGIVIDPTAPSDQRAYAETTHRIAVDPALGFRIVRWSKGTARGVGEREWIRVFPGYDVRYSFNDKFGFHHVPDEVLVTQYLQVASTEGMQFLIETRLAVNEFSYTPHASCFDPPSYPHGYRVVDTATGITYNVGDPPELIAKLTALADRRKAFYDRLSRMEQLPALKAARWINSDPIDLEDCRGRPLDLYFWSINCGPCLYQLPHIEEEYQRSRTIVGGPRIILIHDHVPESTVEKVKRVLDEKGVTIPCMIDTPFDGPTWGQTCAEYGVQAVPTRIRIGADGKIVNDRQTLIGAHDLKTSLFAPKE